MTPSELQAIRERDEWSKDFYLAAKDRRALLAYVDELEALRRNEAMRLLALAADHLKRAEAAEKERDEYRTMWDGLKAQWAGLVKDWEAAEARVRELTEALERVATEHQNYDIRPGLIVSEQYQIGVVDGHRCAASIARAVLAKGPAT